MKNGLKITEPKKNIASSYINEALQTLEKVKKLIEEKDYLWASVRIYYADYYALYAFLRAIGIKSENHDCSIKLIKLLLGENKVTIIKNHRSKRIDAQYYLKYVDESKLTQNYKECKEFVLMFKEKISELKQENIKEFRKKIKELLV